MKKSHLPLHDPALIVYERLGQICVRRRPAHVANPNTEKQQHNRARFALATATAKQYADRLSPEWHDYARRHHKTGLNLLVSQILRHALTTDPHTGALTVDHSQIDLSAPWK